MIKTDEFEFASKTETELTKAIKTFQMNGFKNPNFEMLVIYFLSEILNSIKKRK